MQRYCENLKPQDLPVVNLLTQQHDGCAAWQLCVVQIDFESVKTDKFALVRALKDKGIETNVHFPPLYAQPLLGPLLGWEEEYSQNDLYYARALSLPLYHDLNFEDLDRICRELKSVLGINRHAHLH